MKSKTKPEEPRKREVKFVCQAEHWGAWGNVFGNSCRQRRSASLRRMVTLSMSVPDMVVDQQG